MREELKNDVENLERELSLVKCEKEKELQQVYARYKVTLICGRRVFCKFNFLLSHFRVKMAVAKKDEMLNELTRDHAALKEKCLFLENMLEQQRKEYLIK